MPKRISEKTTKNIVIYSLLTAIAVVGRIMFVQFPFFKPTTAVVIISGIALGPFYGALVGVLTALTSNFFFGQGIWTLWQALAWGLIGFLGGMLSKCKLFNSMSFRLLFGLISGFLYGIIVDSWHIIFFVRPLSYLTVSAAFIAGFYPNLIHSISTVIFLFLLSNPFLRRIDKMKRDF